MPAVYFFYYNFQKNFTMKNEKKRVKQSISEENGDYQ